MALLSQFSTSNLPSDDEVKKKTLTKMEISEEVRVKRQGVSMMKTLPEETVEKIFALLPFPYILKVRNLSKAWQARLSSISAQDNEENEFLATSFQKQVSERSSNWKTFCPVSINEEYFVAYDRACHTWQKFPFLSFLPQDLMDHRCSTFEMEGPLLLVSSPSKSMMYVVNILTQTWKQLPLSPRAYWILDPGELSPKSPESRTVYLGAKLVNESSLAYKVIFFYGGADHCFADVYDSRSGGWRSQNQKFCTSENAKRFLRPPAYLNGVLYMVVGNKRRDLLSFNIDEGTFKEVRMQPLESVMASDRVNLVVCNANLVMVAESRSSVIVLSIDIGSGRLLEVARGPPGALYKGMFESIGVCDCIYFGKGFGSGVLVYNMREDVWSYFPFVGTFHDASIDHLNVFVGFCRKAVLGPRGL